MKNLSFAAFGIALLSGCIQAPAEPTSLERDHVKLYAMNCGHAEGDLSIFGSEGEYDGQTGELAVMCFLVRHPSGDLVWDAGLPDALNALPEGQPTDGGSMSLPITMESQLLALGLTPSDIEYFAPSHGHFDHVGNAGLFSQSKLLVHSDEYQFMFAEEATASFVDSSLVAPLKSMETIQFSADYDVFGDGSVIIVPTPGHTPGHSVLFVDLVNAGPTYLSGDLYHIARSRDEGIVPAINFSKPMTLETFAAFEERVASENATVIIQHSLDDQERLPVLPQYLD